MTEDFSEKELKQIEQFILVNEFYYLEGNRVDTDSGARLVKINGRFVVLDEEGGEKTFEDLKEALDKL